MIVMYELTKENGVLVKHTESVNEFGEIVIVSELLGEPIPTPQDDMDEMLVDHEYRLTLLELGLSE